MDYTGFETGAVLAGRYRIERVLGQGGMGIVVQAMHLQLYQPVAMKFLLPEVLGNQEVVQRFLREAQAAVRLKSEHVARVIDVGTLESGTPYMVLEYLEGADLSRFPRAQLSIGDIVDLVLQACEALAEAHSLGIVHRDIKPANFFVTRRADGGLLLKVLDFGISKAPAMSGNLTATQAVMGTPAYMSPEQMRSSRDVDHRSDIWSLGVVLYELLQGAPPFSGDTFSSMVLKVVNEPLPRLTVRLPGDVDAIVYRCLEKDPALRFPNIADLASALAKYARSEAQAAISVQRTRGIVGATQPGVAFESGLVQRLPSTLSSAAGASTSRSRTGRRWAIVTALGVLAGVIIVTTVAPTGSGFGTGSSRPAQGTRPEPATKMVSAPATDPTPSRAAPAGATEPLAPANSDATARPSADTAAPSPVTTAPPATSPAAAPAQPTTRQGPLAIAPPSASGDTSGSAAAPPSAATARKSKKPTKPAGSTTPRPVTTKPTDDDVLGTRN